MKRNTTANIALGAFLAGAVALYRQTPANAFLYPSCPIHRYFGLLCPGCGATRALAALMHGQLHRAIHLNALCIALLPYALWQGGRCYWRAIKDSPFSWPQPPLKVTYSLLAAALLFMVLRNWG